MRKPVSLYLRVRSASGKWLYVPPVKSPNHKIKPLWGIVNGVPLRCPEGSYHLRYREGGKRPWVNVGTDPDAATAAFIQKTAELNGLAVGMVKAAPVALIPEEPKPAPKAPGRSLETCATDYLVETKNHKSVKTVHAYTKSLALFLESCKKGDIEDIDTADLQAFVLYLRKRGNAARTVRNRVNNVQIFLHHYKLPSVLTGKNLPTFTRKTVRVYSAVDLAKMFSHATLEESDRLCFLLCTGTREQEAQYACWSDIDLNQRQYTVTDHPDLGFSSKDKEEGTIPIPSLLVETLLARRKRYPTSRLIFPTGKDQPDGHLLRIIKSLGLRAGLNCGHCVNKAGKSCADHPVCKDIFLHKFRKTFATILSKKGVAPR
jgi:integrase/recombinase XerD